MIIINNRTLPGVNPGKGFKSTLFAPLELKPFVTNECRLEHGERVLVTAPKFAKRSISLEFQIVETPHVSFQDAYDSLMRELYEGVISLRVPEWSDDVFHLIYTGKSPSYDTGLSGKACKIKVGFDEPNPDNRTDEGETT